jgi:hypothetical protein
LTADQRHEQHALPALLDRGAVTRPGRGRPKLRPDRVAGDKGDSRRTARERLRRRGIGSGIPRKKGERRDGRFDRTAYRARSAVERLLNRLTPHRAIATRDETLADSSHALLTIARILLWLQVCRHALVPDTHRTPIAPVKQPWPSGHSIVDWHSRTRPRCRGWRLFC